MPRVVLTHVRRRHEHRAGCLPGLRSVCGAGTGRHLCVCVGPESHGEGNTIMPPCPRSATGADGALAQTTKVPKPGELLPKIVYKDKPLPPGAPCVLVLTWRPLRHSPRARGRRQGVRAGRVPCEGAKRILVVVRCRHKRALRRLSLPAPRMLGPRSSMLISHRRVRSQRPASRNCR